MGCLAGGRARDVVVFPRRTACPHLGACKGECGVGDARRIENCHAWANDYIYRVSMSLDEIVEEARVQLQPQIKSKAADLQSATCGNRVMANRAVLELMIPTPNAIPAMRPCALQSASPVPR